MSSKSFIITLKDHVPEVDAEAIKKSISGLGGEITHEFSLIKGFTAKLPETLSIESLKSKHSDAIANVEEDKEVSIKK
ncbi:LAMI_0E03378g1_1 [Lachancea mirantina]|uniref:LAMI_0E03378g1_1 n=1 Tax=Lachancea mirantina TaxID=1230905 RepID=A0A1G4JJN6_9SACH|nr:LAMI_0E03378g1_1 [Lachancea mirantina]